MRKYDFISALVQKTVKEVVKKRDEWMKYLNKTVRLYKYPFVEQVSEKRMNAIRKMFQKRFSGEKQCVSFTISISS